MDTPDLRTADKALLALALQDARNYTIGLLDDWRAWKDRIGIEGVNSPDPRHVPCLAIINPPLWELGHVAWFMEYWCQRYRGEAMPPSPSRLPNADRWYDSRQVPHDSRRLLDLPHWDATRATATTTKRSATTFLSASTVVHASETQANRILRLICS